MLNYFNTDVNKDSETGSLPVVQKIVKVKVLIFFLQALKFYDTSHFIIKTLYKKRGCLKINFKAAFNFYLTLEIIQVLLFYQSHCYFFITLVNFCKVHTR